MANRGKSQANLELIAAARAIAGASHPISVRGIAYKLFVLGLIPDMSTKSTKRVSVQLTEAREQGLIPWWQIVDETRSAERIPLWSDPTERLAAAVQTYRRDPWQEQDHWVEVWSEKGTVRGVLAPVLREFGVTFRVHHGFSSATALNGIAEETAESDKSLTVLYVGDWDPSGLCMSETDLPGRMARYGGDFTLKRIALEEADTLTLPGFPLESKRGDSRHDWFKRQYGDQCWELDALDPGDLRERVAAEIRALIDPDAWALGLAIEEAEKEDLKAFHADWQARSGPGRI